MVLINHCGRLISGGIPHKEIREETNAAPAEPQRRQSKHLGHCPKIIFSKDDGKDRAKFRLQASEVTGTIAIRL